ncbi:MAG: TetR/AcrR family transcriptional regulator [Pseudomonadales bacterium]|nr:TetR/AcrR family transcriptional regulator [Pseudomonadales bacterium]
MSKVSRYGTNNQQRRPVQLRSQLRAAKIIDTAEAILRDSGPAEITFSTVALQAKIPTSSVYQYFTSKEVLLLALAEKLIARIQPHFREELSCTKISQWPDIIHALATISQRFYSASPYAAPLLLDSYLTNNISSPDTNITDRIAKQLKIHFELRFWLPVVDNLDRRFLVAIEIAQTILTGSQRRYGKITDDYFEEAERAMISYLANYFPPVLAKR